MVLTKLKNNNFSVMELLRSGVAQLQAAHVESASLDARILLEFALGVTREQMLLMMEKRVSEEQEMLFAGLIAQRATHKPVAQLIGQREFWGMEFHVTENTLDPRADSETLIEAVLERFPDRSAPLKVLDFGTGTGCLLLAVLKEYPNAMGIGVDICPKALEVAFGNAHELELSARASFTQGCWGDGLEGQFDLILSNPPYIPSSVIPTLSREVAQFEPKGALDGGEDGLDCYRALIPHVARLLAPSGVAAFEIGMGQRPQLEEIAAAQGLKALGAKKDMAGVLRCVLITK